MTVRMLEGHVLDVLPTIEAERFQMCVTSVPYWMLRSYGTEPQIWGGDPECDHVWGGPSPLPGYRRGNKPGDLSTSSLTNPERQDVLPRPTEGGAFCQCCSAWRGEWGQEPTPEQYVEHTVAVFREVRRVLRKDATLWLNIGDTYWNDPGGQNGSEGWVGSKAKEANKQLGRQKRATGSTHPTLKRKDLVGIPWRVAFALQADGWYLRAENIWHKPNPMPESCTDRPTRAHEQVFLFAKRGDYFYDQQATLEPVSGIKANLSFHAATNALIDRRNPRDVWTIPLAAFSEAHFATYPPDLVARCIVAGTSEKGRCPTCRAPWRRIVERVPTGETQKMADGWDTGPGAHGSIHRNGRQKGETGVPVTASVTVGWEPSCACPLQEPVPCEVLDICFGSGTTGVVADRLGRDCTGIEVKPEYAEMGRRRVQGDSPMFAEVALIASGTGAVTRSVLAEGPPLASASGTPAVSHLRLPLEESA